MITRILFIEDDLVLVDLFKEYFKEREIMVVQCDNLEGLYKCLDVNVYHACIIDNKLLRNSELNSKLNTKHPNTSFILLMGALDSENNFERLKFFKRVFHKPIDMDTFVQEIDLLLR